MSYSRRRRAVIDVQHSPNAFRRHRFDGQVAGYDCLYIDLEHSGITVGETGQICVAALAVGIAPFVRVPAAAYGMVGQLLDLGAMGIIAPHISNAADAQRMVARCKYPPLGHRSNSSGIPHQWLSDQPLLKLQAQLNAETMVFAMIETREGLQNVDEIAAVAGVDCLFVGTSDLTAELGIPGQFDSPVLMDALKRITTAARKHGKHASLGGGIKGSAPGLLKSFLDIGFGQISVGNDVGMLTAAMRQRAADIRAQTG
jgi:4-hydroxy-2-oxoheptanedioate aldolase